MDTNASTKTKPSFSFSVRNSCPNCGGNFFQTTSDGEVQKCDTCCVTVIDGKTYYGGQDCECEDHEIVDGIMLSPNAVAIR